MISGHYDLIVVGSGPGGQKAAINAAKVGKKVALIEKQELLGGVSVHSGTIPSKALREAAIYLSGYRQRQFYGMGYRVKQEITMKDLMTRCDLIVRTEMDVIAAQMERNNIHMITGRASFTDPHTIRVHRLGTQVDLSADCIVLAVGSEPYRPEFIPFQPDRVMCSDMLLRMKELPRTMLIIGGGVIGVEYACILQAIGVRVTLVEGQKRLLPFLDDEIAESLQYRLRENGIRMKLGESLAEVSLCDEGVVAQLNSGKELTAETMLYAVGRQGATAQLNLEAAGLSADKRGKLTVNEHYQTEVPHIYAVGDVIGFPSLASTSMEQGRLATCHAFELGCETHIKVFPYGIYTIPEISTVGKNEAELTEQGVPYEVGLARYREIARGQLLGDPGGILKLLFHQKSHQLLGIHIIGEQATELVHIGQAVLALGGTIEFFINNVFNYPTLAECYKVAALDGMNRCRHKTPLCALPDVSPATTETEVPH